MNGQFQTTGNLCNWTKQLDEQCLKINTFLHVLAMGWWRITARAEGRLHSSQISGQSQRDWLDPAPVWKHICHLNRTKEWPESLKMNATCKKTSVSLTCSSVYYYTYVNAHTHTQTHTHTHMHTHTPGGTMQNWIIGIFAKWAIQVNSLLLKMGLSESHELSRNWDEKYLWQCLG